jgi:hypothetical protein
VNVIDPLSFVWGCLTADTAITLEDGSRKRAAEITIGERVRSGGGRVRVVEDVVTGVEKEPCLRILSSDGRSLLLTSQHPMITRAGVRQAGALEAGDVLLTEDGEATVTSVAPERYDGTVYNLKLSRHSDDDDDTTHFAGGVLVGDQRMQGLFAVREPEEARDPAAILAALPPEAHHDFLNAERQRRGEPLVAIR